MRARWLLFGVLLTWTVADRAHAANYRFSVPEAEVTVRIQPDGAARIHYKLTFKCARGAHPIDVVDIGMPHMGKGHRPVSAAIDGRTIPNSSIRVSEVLTPRGSGYEVHLGSRMIQPGRSGVFAFIGIEDRMVWQDTTDPEQASFRFTPTWFGAPYVRGKTKLILRYVLPIPKAAYPEARERILWHKSGQEFSAKGVMEGDDRASVAWVREVSLTGPHLFSVSFPKRFVEHVRRDSLWDVFFRWFSGSREAQVASGLAVLILFGLLFFTQTRATGWSVFLVLAGVLIYGMVVSPVFHLWCWPGLALLWGLWFWVRRRRRQHYFPATVSREGGGICRGLTAMEAALLLEVPLHKILTMIIFGLAKKGVVKIRSTEPLRIAIAPGKEANGIWVRENGRKVRLRDYEPLFLHVFKGQARKSVEEMRLTAAFDELVKNTVKKVTGFDLERTRKYYRHIVDRAWKQVEREGGYEARFQRADKTLPWLMLDSGWGGRLEELDPDYTYRPVWWSYGHHTPARGSGGLAIPKGPAGDSTMPTTTFSDVANSVTGRFETMSNTMVGKLDSLGLDKSGGLDLSGFDSFTKTMLSEMASGSGGGFSGGCACAGCACACACAGGGR